MKMFAVIFFSCLQCVFAQAPVWSPPWLALNPNLMKDLKAHWKLDETSGTRADSHSTNTLSVSGSLTNVTGMFSNAVDFTGGNLNRTLTVNDGIWPTNINMTWAGWVKFDVVSGEQALISQYFAAGGGGYVIQTFNSNLVFYVDGTGSLDSITAADVLVTNTWYLFICWHDTDHDKIAIQINNGTVASKAHSDGIFPGVATFQLGDQSATSRPLNGKMDSVSIWRRVLTETERRLLNNNGNGVNYPF